MCAGAKVTTDLKEAWEAGVGHAVHDQLLAVAGLVRIGVVKHKGRCSCCLADLLSLGVHAAACCSCGRRGLATVWPGLPASTVLSQVWRWMIFSAVCLRGLCCTCSAPCLLVTVLS